MLALFSGGSDHWILGCTTVPLGSLRVPPRLHVIAAIDIGDVASDFARQIADQSGGNLPDTANTASLR